jgi:hypothetical protein
MMQADSGKFCCLSGWRHLFIRRTRATREAAKRRSPGHNAPNSTPLWCLFYCCFVMDVWRVFVQMMKDALALIVGALDSCSAEDLNYYLVLALEQDALSPFVGGVNVGSGLD